jgi:hypothetical protein
LITSYSFWISKTLLILRLTFVEESALADIDNLAQLVIDQTSCSKAAAVKALNETNGDVVAAIMVCLTLCILDLNNY